jgi:hypothetical protein
MAHLEAAQAQLALLPKDHRDFYLNRMLPN